MSPVVAAAVVGAAVGGAVTLFPASHAAHVLLATGSRSLEPMVYSWLYLTLLYVSALLSLLPSSMALSLPIMMFLKCASSSSLLLLAIYQHCWQGS